MIRTIKATSEDVKWIARAFSVTPRMVQLSLRYESDTDIAKRIRRLAIARGAKRMVMIEEDRLTEDILSKIEG